ncbi:MAG: copper resistance protein NlpE [Paracoccus sp. (in: a-proteobacteria)]|nr:copper resistance protein NlpE [Paracoccus sp. (in: a-proteobacteria)]
MRKILLTASLTLLAAGAGFAQHNTRNSVDWDGRYVGTMPCASCPGIETTLTINEAGFYTLAETYLEEDDGDFLSEGTFEWDADGSTIQLEGDDEQRAFLIGEGMAWMVGSDGTPDDAHPLVKLTEYNGAGAQLYVDPDSVEQDGGKVSFDGLINFEHEAEGGHRSLSATFQIDCAKGEVMMPRVSYFAGTDAQGEPLHEAQENDESWAPIPSDSDDVIAQAKAAYCAG